MSSYPWRTQQDWQAWASKVEKALSELQRDALLEIAKSAILSPQPPTSTVELAESLLGQRSQRLQCHGKFDPSDAGHRDCVMMAHDERKKKIEMYSRGWDRYAWPCCERLDHDREPCFEGWHVSDWKAAKEMGHRSYWRDARLQKKGCKEEECSACFRRCQQRMKEQPAKKERALLSSKKVPAVRR